MAESALMRAYRNFTASGQGLTKTARETAHTVRAGAESALVGAALGAAHAGMQNGLDYVVVPAKAAGATQTKDGTVSPPKEAITVPIDGVVGLLGLGGAVALAHEDGISQDLRNVGAAALSVFAFRKGADLMAAKMRKENKQAGGTVPSQKSLIHSMMQSQPHGEFGFGNEDQNDPILALAANTR